MQGLGRAVLVTGAGGFLGAALARRLLDEGHRVFGTYRTRRPPPGVVSIQADLRLEAEVEQAFATAEPALVFHLASAVNPDRDADALGQRLDDVTLPTDRVALACLRRGARLVAAGTCEEYGDHAAPFHEDMAPRPVSAYSAAKALAGQWVMWLARARGLRATWVRPFLTYGAGQRPGSLVAQAMRAAQSGLPFPMTDGAQTRELLHVDDMARALALAARPEAEGRVVNLCGAPERPVIEVVEAVFRACGADETLIQRGALPRRAGEVDRFCGDPRICRELLGFYPSISLEEGLARTLAAAAAAPVPLADRVRRRPLSRFADARGALSKWHAGPVAGEVYGVRAEPGARRGDHRHRRMAERFVGTSGEPWLGVFDPEQDEVLWLPLRDEQVEVPPGLGHVIVAAGGAPAEVLAFAERVHDPADVEPCRVPDRGRPW